MAPRLDRQGHLFPWVRRHFIISHVHVQRRGRFGVRGVVCSRTVSAGLCRRVRKHAIAVPRAARRLGVGDGLGPAGVIGSVTAVKHDAVSRVGVIGSVVGNVRRPPNHNRARASAQRRNRRLLACECARGRAVMRYSPWRRSMAHAVSVVWPAAWRYGVCLTGKNTTGNAADVGGGNFGRGAVHVSTPRRRVFVHFFPPPTSVKFPGPQRRKERAGSDELRVSRFLSSEWGPRGECVHDVGAG